MSATDDADGRRGRLFLAESSLRLRVRERKKKTQVQRADVTSVRNGSSGEFRRNFQRRWALNFAGPGSTRQTALDLN